MESLTGTLLVASPKLTEGIFAHSVCLVVHHGEQGSVGFLLNRPLNPPQPQFWHLITGNDRAPERLMSVHFGGPIAGPVTAIHADQQLAEAQTGEGVFVAAQRDHLQALLGRGDAPMRIIVGHAGWSPGQLEAEIAAGIWYTLPATVERVFEADEAMWPALVRKGAGERLAGLVGARPPADVAWN